MERDVPRMSVVGADRDSPCSNTMTPVRRGQVMSLTSMLRADSQHGSISVSEARSWLACIQRSFCCDVLSTTLLPSNSLKRIIHIRLVIARPARVW